MEPIIRLGSIEVHPAANLFPEMPQEELMKLVDSIKINGVRNPLVFYDGKLLDGRNRLRASLLASVNTDKLPRRNIPLEEDPYQWAWDANCSRLDYMPAQKAAIRIKIEEASGELARMRAELKRQANESRSEKVERYKLSTQNTKEKDSRGQHCPRLFQIETSIIKTPSRQKLANQIAEKAHVSSGTVKRILKMKKEDPQAFENLAAGKKPDRPPQKPRAKPVNWSVPRNVEKLGLFLRERLSSKECRRLTEILSGH